MDPRKLSKEKESRGIRRWKGRARAFREGGAGRLV